MMLKVEKKSIRVYMCVFVYVWIYRERESVMWVCLILTTLIQTLEVDLFYWGYDAAI